MKRPAVITRPQIIEVPVVVYRKMPDALTAPILRPPRPPFLCTLNAQATICALDALATIPSWDAALQMCNADRMKVRTLGSTDVLH